MGFPTLLSTIIPFKQSFSEDSVAICFHLPLLASVVFALESNSLSFFLNSLWASLREMEKNFLILSSLVLKAPYVSITVVPHCCRLA